MQKSGEGRRVEHLLQFFTDESSEQDSISFSHYGIKFSLTFNIECLVPIYCSNSIDTLFSASNPGNSLD